jgi:hypothetical protein
MHSRNHGDRSTADWGRGRDQILPPFLWAGYLAARSFIICSASFSRYRPFARGNGFAAWHSVGIKSWSDKHSS